MYSSKKNSVSVPLLVFIYSFFVLMGYYENRYDDCSGSNLIFFNYLKCNGWCSMMFNGFFLLLNIFLIYQKFNIKNRRNEGVWNVFIYALLYSKIWFCSNYNLLLTLDAAILIFLLLLNKEYLNINQHILALYTGIIFGWIALSGLNAIIAFLESFLFILIYIKPSWKYILIFIIGFLLPVYFLISINWLMGIEPFYYIHLMVKNFYSVQWWKWDFDSHSGFIYTHILILLFLFFYSFFTEFRIMHYFTSKERKDALYFFITMLLFFLVYISNYFNFGVHLLYVLALPMAYYIGNLLCRVNNKIKYFILLIVFYIITVL